MSIVKFIVGLSLASTLGFFYFAPGSNDKVLKDDGVTLRHIVERDTFESIITETGDIESSNSVDIKCEVKSAGGAGTTILEIVEEGAFVEKGDFLIQFDDAVLRESLTAQEIVVATDEAAIIETQSELDKAQHMLKEYRSGTFLVERETFAGELFQADINLKSAQDRLTFMKRMVQKGYKSQLQLDAERLGVEKALKDVEVAKRKLEAHIKFTYEKFVNQFEADIKKHEAILKAKQITLKLSQHRRDDIQDQIFKCRRLAPKTGQVVYNNNYRREIVIEEGVQIREGQIVLRLPDRRNMHVQTRINDSKINQVQVGQLANVELDVDPDVKIRAVIETVDTFPYPRKWSGSPIEYGTTLRILSPPDILRPGQRAKVHIAIDQREDVLQTPIQSVVNRNDAYYCLVREADKWTVREVAIGPNNGSFAVVERGLEEGEQVALNPDLIWDQMGLPEVTEATEIVQQVGSPQNSSKTLAKSATR